MVVVDGEHFVVHRCTVFTFYNMKSCFPEELCIMRVAYTIFETVQFEPVNIDASFSFHGLGVDGFRVFYVLESRS